MVNVDGTTTSQETFDRWLHDRRASPPAARPARRSSSRIRRTSRSASPTARRRCPSRSRASRSRPRRSSRSQCQQQYDQLKGQVMSFLVRAAWLEAEAERQDIKVSDKEVKASFDKARKQAFPTAKAYAAFLKESGQTEADLLYRQRTQLIEQKITREADEGHRRRSARRTSPTTTTRTRPSSSRSPRRATCSSILTKTEAQAERRQGRARGRHAVRGGRQEVLDRPDDEGQRRAPEQRHAGPGREGLRQGRLRRAKKGKIVRPGQDERGLLRLPGHADHAGARPSRSTTSCARRSSRSSSPTASATR